MSKKEYNVITTLREALPRSKRRRAVSQSGGGGTTVNVVSSASDSGDGHTHDNKAVLDAQSMDDDGYLYLRHRTEDAETSVTEKVKAGYADEAGRAKEADNADMWDKRQFDDYLDQPVRKTDSVQHKEVITDTLRGAGQFVDGLLGSGYRLWGDENGVVHLTIDKLTVRQTMVVLELLIEQIRSVGGQIVVSAANGKIKTVEEVDDCYRITFEQDNRFVAHDLVRCQTFTGNAIKSYWVEVSAVEDNSILVPVDEFEGVVPLAGDECVLMGNTENPARQNLILISATEDGQPRIDVMNGVNSKSFAGCLRARFGNLDGISDTWFPSDKQPHGDGIYCDNAYLRGTFVLETGEDIKTKFEITEGKIEAAVTGIRQDFLGENGYLNNAAFADGMDKWTTENETVFFLVGNKWIWANGNVLSKKGNSASVTSDNGRVVVRIRNKYILQKHTNLRVIPEMGTTSAGEKTALPVYLSFFYRCAEAGTLKVEFENVDKTGFVEFDSFSVEGQLEATDVYKQFTCSGLWNGTGDFKLSFTGDIYLYMLVLSTDKVEAFTYQYKTLLEQSERLVKISAAVYDKDEALLEETGLVVQSNFASLMATAMKGDETIQASITASVEDAMSKVNIAADQIEFLGKTIINGNFVVDEEGNLTLKNLTATGTVNATAGTIGGWVIGTNSLHSEDYSYPTSLSDANGAGSLLKQNGLMINCVESNGVLAGSTGQQLAAYIGSKGNRVSGITGAYIVAAETDSEYAYLSSVTALELRATNAYSHPAEKPLALKVTAGFCDIPGVLLAGYVTKDGTASYRFGKQGTPYTVSRSGVENTYEYTITHSIGHQNYVVMVTPFISTDWKKVHAIVTSRLATSFSVKLIDSGTDNDGENQDFFFVAIGDNV